MSWNSTLALFANEFHVPLLSPTAAAYLGTAAELGLPVLLALGIGTRFAAIALFMFNIVAVISYPDLSDAGLKDHMLWGALLLVTLVYGPGKIAVDHWLKRGDVTLTRAARSQGFGEVSGADRAGTIVIRSAYLISTRKTSPLSRITR